MDKGAIGEVSGMHSSCGLPLDLQYLDTIQCCVPHWSWIWIRIRIRIQEARPMGIQADPDPDPDQTFESQKVVFLHKKYP